MPSSTRVLHQFPVSHYCEKTRWNLDAKGLQYEINNQFPGLHIGVNRRLSGLSTVPMLRDGQRTVGDSTKIALYLEQTYPDRALIPPAQGARERVLELELYFSKTFGPEVRRLCYGEALRYPRAVRKLFFANYPATTKRVGPLLVGSFLEAQLRRMYRLDEDGLGRAHAVVAEAIERLEAELANDPARYLSDDQLSLADISAASLLAPLVGPPASPWAELSAELRTLHELREKTRQRIAGRWVLWLYARHRQPPTA
jgi:glutathione S-transferase